MFLDRLLPHTLKQIVSMKKRLILINEETFEELFSFKLSLMNVFVIGTLSVFLLIISTTVLIAFTPLREFIPGYASTQLKREATLLAIKTDSLTQALEKNEAYMKAIQNVLTDKLEYTTFNKDSILAQSQSQSTEEALKASSEEMELRKEMAKAEQKKSTPKTNKK